MNYKLCVKELIQRNGHEVTFQLFHYSKIGSSDEWADPCGMMVDSLSLIGLRLKILFGLSHSKAWIERFEMGLITSPSTRAALSECSEEEIEDSDTSLQIGWTPPGGLIVKSLSLIGLSLKNSFGLGHAGV